LPQTAVRVEAGAQRLGQGGAGGISSPGYFVLHLAQLVGQGLMQITLRPHPSDPTDKYTA